MAKEEKVVEEKKIETKVKVITAQTDFVWAFNKVKLKQSYQALVAEKKLNPAVVIDEESIKEMYLAKAGLLTDDQQRISQMKRPKSTSNRE